MTPKSLRAWREARGLSRRDASDVLGVAEGTLRGLEDGRYATSPLWGALDRLTLALDQIDELRARRAA
jgi:transcriptional regulator with XRE-family HTH domain